MIAEKVSAAVMYSGAATSATSGVVLGLTKDEWYVYGIIFGAFLGFVGLCVNWGYKHAHLQLAKKNAKLIGDEG